MTKPSGEFIARAVLALVVYVVLAALMPNFHSAVGIAALLDGSVMTGLVAVGVGCLEFTLDKGQEKDWFGDPMIRAFAILAAATLIFFTWWEWHHPDPIVDLKLLKNRNFGTAVFLQLILGMVLFGSTVLIPQYLQGLLGYTAERAGMVLSPAGFVMMLMMFVMRVVMGGCRHLSAPLPA